MSDNCEHDFGDQFETMFSGVYGKKCKKCGLLNYTQRNYISSCGCYFENDQSNCVMLCEECSKLPCHNIK